jgi:RecB family exonuclease
LLRSPELLRIVEQQTARVSPTALESYLQCPFQYFGRRTLRLEKPPAVPEKRLDALAEGGIVHAVLAELYRGNQPLEAVFERVFRDTCEKQRIPASYRTESRRHRLFLDLRTFLAEPSQERAPEIRVEETFAFELEPGLTISGRIDRLDLTGDGRAVVIDYKYSTAQKTKAKLEDPNLLQPPLYLIAVERAFGLRPAGFFYYGLRGGVQRSGWEEPIAPEWLEQAAARSRQAAAEIRAGEIAACPADAALCGWCEFRDVCRYRGSAAALAREA